MISETYLFLFVMALAGVVVVWGAFVGIKIAAAFGFRLCQACADVSVTYAYVCALTSLRAFLA